MKNTLASMLLSTALFVAPLAAQAQDIYTTIAPPAPIAETQTAAPSPSHVWVGGYWNWNGSQYTWTQGHWELPQEQGAGWEQPQWVREGGRYRFRRGRWNRRQGAQVGVQVGGQQVGVQIGVQPNMPQGNWRPGMQPGAQVVQPAQGTVWVQPNPPQGTVIQQPVIQQPVIQQPIVQPPVVQQQVVVGPNGGVVGVAPPRLRRERRPRMVPPGQTWVPGYWNWDGSQYQWVAGHVEAVPNPGARWQAPRYQRRGRQWVVTPGRWR
ncbi:MAG: hypothetical protein R3A48_22215 [Polyangiales bacterium]